MKLFLDVNQAQKEMLIDNRTVIELLDIRDESVEKLLLIESVCIVAEGSDCANKLVQVVNSRPNEHKPLSMLQTHPDLIIITDQKGASLLL